MAVRTLRASANLALLELLFAHHPGLHNRAATLERSIQGIEVSPPFGGGEVADQHEDVVIAIRPGRAARARAEENDTADGGAVRWSTRRRMLSRMAASAA